MTAISFRWMDCSSLYLSHETPLARGPGRPPEPTTLPTYVSKIGSGAMLAGASP